MSAPVTKIIVVEDKNVLGVQWWHPMGDLTGYEVRYGIDGSIDRRLAYDLAGRNSNGSSWTAYLSDVDETRVSCVSAQVRVRFSEMDWSEWSEIVVWSAPSRTAKRQPSRTVTPPSIRHVLASPPSRMRGHNVLAESGGYILRRPTPPNSRGSMRDVENKITRTGSTPPGKPLSAEENCNRMHVSSSPSNSRGRMCDVENKITRAGSTPPGKQVSAEVNCNRTLVNRSHSRAHTPQARKSVCRKVNDNAATPTSATRAGSPAIMRAANLSGAINTRSKHRDLNELECVLPGGVPYTPNTKSILVIAPGAPWVWDSLPQAGETSWPAQWSAEALEEAGYDVTVVWDSEYDAYPKGWRDGRPDLKSNNGKNHATLADDYVVPKLKDLVAAGRGPAVILAGSRGGQCTLPRLWQLGWRGGAVCVNAGCTKLGRLPRHCRLALVTGGLDFFKQSANPELARLMPREDPKVPILLYHDPKMGHTGAPDDFERTGGHHILLAHVLMQIIDLTSSNSAVWCARQKGTAVDGPWPANAYLKVV